MPTLRSEALDKHFAVPQPAEPAAFDAKAHALAIRKMSGLSAMKLPVGDAGGLVAQRAWIRSRRCGINKPDNACQKTIKKIATHAHPYCAGARFYAKPRLKSSPAPLRASRNLPSSINAGTSFAQIHP